MFFSGGKWVPLKNVGVSQHSHKNHRTLWPEGFVANSKRYRTFFFQATRYNPNSPRAKGYTTFHFGDRKTRDFSGRPIQCRTKYMTFWFRADST